MKLTPFQMERYQSTWEHRVEINLSESGVHPMTVGELMHLAGREARDVDDIRLGYGQSNGSEALKARIAELYPDTAAESVLVTIGGAEANFAAAWHLMEPGEPAAVLLPTYMQVPGLLESFGGEVLPVPLLEEEGWQPDLDALDDALGAGARFVLVTNPNNPTGAVLTESSMEEIVQRAHRHGAWILADEVYQGAEREGRLTPSFRGRYERVLVTNSLSKAYGLPGLRLGWVLGPPEVVETLWSRTDYTTIAPASVSDALAVVALEPETRRGIFRRTRTIVRSNLDVLERWLAEQDGLFSWRPPDAGAICYVRYDAPVPSMTLAERLRTEKDVLVVPGEHFGMDRYLRIGFGLPEEELVEALDRLAALFRDVG